jgi:hypothetical protein
MSARRAGTNPRALETNPRVARGRKPRTRKAAKAKGTKLISNKVHAALWATGHGHLSLRRRAPRSSSMCLERSEDMTDVSLREHFEALFAAADRRHDERLATQHEALRVALQSAEKAVLKAEAATERRFEGVNEFRGALNDIVGKMMPRHEADNRFLTLSEKLDELRQRPVGETDQRFRAMAEKLDRLPSYVTKDEMTGKLADLEQHLTRVSTVIAQRDAKNVGIYAGWGYIVGLVGFVISLISVAYAIAWHGGTGPH